MAIIASADTVGVIFILNAVQKKRGGWRGGRHYLFFVSSSKLFCQKAHFLLSFVAVAYWSWWLLLLSVMNAFCSSMFVVALDVAWLTNQ